MRTSRIIPAGMIAAILAFAAALAFVSPALAESVVLPGGELIPVRVERVVDGDTWDVCSDKHGCFRAREAAYDAA